MSQPAYEKIKRKNHLSDTEIRSRPIVETTGLLEDWPRTPGQQSSASGFLQVSFMREGKPLRHGATRTFIPLHQEQLRDKQTVLE